MQGEKEGRIGNQLQSSKQKGKEVLEQGRILDTNKTMRFIVSVGRHWIVSNINIPYCCKLFCTLQAGERKYTFGKLTCCSKEHI